LESEGRSEDEIAQALGVSVGQLQGYIREHRTDIDYAKARVLGRKEEWLRALGKRAVGYEYKERRVTTTEVDGRKKVFTEITEKHMPPDTAALVWLLEHGD
jgi:transposase